MLINLHAKKLLFFLYRPFPTKPTFPAYFAGLSDVLQQKNMLKMQNFASNRPLRLFLWLFDPRFMPKQLKNAFIILALALSGVKK
jgi:hypothetical protein